MDAPAVRIGSGRRAAGAGIMSDSQGGVDFFRHEKMTRMDSEMLGPIPIAHSVSVPLYWMKRDIHMRCTQPTRYDQLHKIPE